MSNKRINKPLMLLIAWSLLSMLLSAQPMELVNRAHQGDAIAQRDLGLYYSNTESKARQLRSAVQWFTKAARQNDAEAQYYLGLCYYNGDGVVKSWSEALYWFSIAAARDHTGALISAAQTALRLPPEISAGIIQKANQWRADHAEP